MNSNRSTSFSENELIVSLKKNEREAFDYLYDHYSGSLYKIIRKIIRDEVKAQDAMQDTFLKIWKNMEFYCSEKGSLFTWMLNIARNTAIDSLRRDDWKDNKNQSLNNGPDPELSQFFVHQHLSSFLDLRELVDQLKPDRKVLVDLVYYQGYTHEEASKKLRVPVGTVKSRMRTAIQDLRVYYHY